MDQNIISYNFKKPQRYSADNIRFLSLVVEELCKNINDYNVYEKKNNKIKLIVDKIEQTNFDEFMKIIPVDSIIVEHAMVPLVQNLIFQIDKPVSHILLDTLLGGNGDMRNIDFKRDLTTIDQELLSHMLGIFFKRLRVPASCHDREIIAVNLNIDIGQKFAVSESVFLGTIRVMVEDTHIGNMRFCTPYSCMEPVLKDLETKNLFREDDKDSDGKFISDMYDNMCKVDLEIEAQLGKTFISVGELLKIEKGDVLILDTNIDEAIEASVSNSRAYKCKPGTIKNKRGIVITGSVKEED